MEKQAITLLFVWTAKYFVVRSLGCKIAKYSFFNLQPYSLGIAQGNILQRIYLQLFQHNGRSSSTTIANTGNTSLTRLQAEKVFQVLHVPKYNSELRIPCSTYNTILSYLTPKVFPVFHFLQSNTKLPVHQVVDNPRATSPKGVAEAHCTAVNVNPGCCIFC